MEQKERNPQWTYLFILSPYIAVFIGLYCFNHAFIAMGLYHLLLGIPLWYSRKKWIPELKTKPFLGKWSLVALCTGVCIGPVLYFLWPWMVQPGLNLVSTLQSYRIFEWRWIALLIFFASIQPLGEELFWRHILDGSFWKGVMADLFFMGYHLMVLRLFVSRPWCVVAAILLFSGGQLWRWIKKQDGGSWTVILSHALADISIIVGVYLLALNGQT